MVLLTKINENPKETYGLSNLTIPFGPTIRGKKKNQLKYLRHCKCGFKSLLIKSEKLNFNFVLESSYAASKVKKLVHE